MRVLVVAKQGGTIEGWPLDTWVSIARAKGCEVTVRDPDACARSDMAIPVDCTVDELLGWS